MQLALTKKKLRKKVFIACMNKKGGEEKNICRMEIKNAQRINAFDVNLE